MGVRGGGGFVRVELLSGVVPRDRKSGGYVSLDMGHDAALRGQPFFIFLYESKNLEKKPR